jgi:hypothetical protein
MILPTEKIQPLRENVKFMVLFGKPKSGKTTIMSKLDDCLLIDLENGSDFLEVLSVKANNLTELYSIKQALEQKIKENDNKFPYKYIAIDTATKLEEMSLILAKKLYKDTVQGKGFEGNDVTKLPNGAGYRFVREAFEQIIDWFIPLCDALILLAHTNVTLINKEGKELNEMKVDLTGKLERIIAGKSDALGYVYREKNKTIISFEGGEDIVVEARPSHLKGKKIVIAESDENGNITTDWSLIFKQ